MDASVPTYRTPLRRIEWLLDDSAIARKRGARLTRIALALLFIVYGVIGEVLSILRENDIKLTPIAFFIGAAAMLSNRLGTLSRSFIPVILGLFAYGTAADYATDLSLGVHYKPQIWLDQHLTPGPLPTVWLQQHLYHGHTGVLEGFAVFMYASHFFVPILFGAGLVLTARGHEFKNLMFSILTVSILATITFVLAPTAPPWLAVQDGYLHGVHNILKTSLSDLHMVSLSKLEGDPSKYDVTAAVPSLHIAFPVICLLVAIHARARRWVTAVLSFDVVGVAFSIVYTGQHYLVDAIVGGAYAVAAWLLVLALGRIEKRRIAVPRDLVPVRASA